MPLDVGPSGLPFLLFLIGSLTIALAAMIDLPLVCRGLQGVGVAASVAIARAMVRDQFVGPASTRLLNFIGLLMGIGPALAPSLEAIFLSVADWHTIFLFMVGSATSTLILLALYFPETNTVCDMSLARPHKIVRNYRILIGHENLRIRSCPRLYPWWLAYTLPLLAVVFIDDVGLTPRQLGLVVPGQPIAYMLGAALTARLLRSHEAIVLIPFDLAIIGLAGLFPVSLLHERPPVLSVMMPVMGWAFGFALVQPGVPTLALARFPANAGSAALTGILQIGGGVAGSAIAAFLSMRPLPWLQYSPA